MLLHCARKYSQVSHNMQSHLSLSYYSRGIMGNDALWACAVVSDEEQRLYSSSIRETQSRQKEWQMLWTRRDESNVWLVHHRLLHATTTGPHGNGSCYHGDERGYNKGRGESSLLKKNYLFWHSCALQWHTWGLFIYTLFNKQFFLFCFFSSVSLNYHKSHNLTKTGIYCKFQKMH